MLALSPPLCDFGLPGSEGKHYKPADAPRELFAALREMNTPSVIIT